MKSGSDIDEPPKLSVAFVLLPGFTLSTLAGFTDALRLAADHLDRSRQRHCKWDIVGLDRRPVRSSCGIEVIPWQTFDRAAPTDYTVVVGGQLSGQDDVDDKILEYLRQVGATGGTLVAICTGIFTLARAGLMKSQISCVHWAHVAEFTAEFPDHRVDAESIYRVADRRISCAGGQGAVDLAIHLIERHCGPSLAAKVASGMLIEAPRSPRHIQPLVRRKWFSRITDARLKRAVLLMEHAPGAGSISIAAVAQDLGVSTKTLSRLFEGYFGFSPSEFRRVRRVARARWELVNTQKPIVSIAYDLGFSDVSHLNRQYRKYFGIAPGRTRVLAHAESSAPSNGLAAEETLPLRDQLLRSDGIAQGDWPPGEQVPT